MEVEKTFSVDDKYGKFAGFIKAKNKSEANRKVKAINRGYKITSCLTHNKDRSVKSKYTYFERTSGWKYSKQT